jgi:hypothetical protein
MQAKAITNILLHCFLISRGPSFLDFPDPFRYYPWIIHSTGAKKHQQSYCAALFPQGVREPCSRMYAQAWLAQSNKASAERCWISPFG